MSIIIKTFFQYILCFILSIICIYFCVYNEYNTLKNETFISYYDIEENNMFKSKTFVNIYNDVLDNAIHSIIYNTYMYSETDIMNKIDKNIDNLSLELDIDDYNYLKAKIFIYLNNFNDNIKSNVFFNNYQLLNEIFSYNIFKKSIIFFCIILLIFVLISYNFVFDWLKKIGIVFTMTNLAFMLLLWFLSKILFINNIQYISILRSIVDSMIIANKRIFWLFFILGLILISIYIFIINIFRKKS